MVKAILTENYVQWFSNDSKEPFLEYNIDTDKLTIHNEKQYFRESIWLGYESPISSISYWLPKNCTSSIKSIIMDKVCDKLIKYSKINYALCPTRLRRFGKVKTIMTENSIKWFSQDHIEPFLEYFIDSDDLKIYDNDIYILERHEALYFSLFETGFSKYWYPKKCSQELKLIIQDIIDGKFFTNKEERKNRIKLWKEIGFIK